MQQRIEKSIIIESPPAAVWDALTNPGRMKQWMSEPDMNMEIFTDWKIGNSIAIKGFHHVKFENKGTILQFEPNRILKYDYLSSISRLPNRPENRTAIEFKLALLKNQTLLTVIASNFPTESIFKHVDFYWNGTIGILKEYLRSNRATDQSAVEQIQNKSRGMGQ